MAYMERPGMGFDLSTIHKGSDVYCSDDKKIGDVSEITTEYIHVKKGFLFTKDLYIPASAVDHVEHDKVYLNVPCDRVESFNWNQPPHGTRLGM